MSVPLFENLEDADTYDRLRRVYGQRAATRIYDLAAANAQHWPDAVAWAESHYLAHRAPFRDDEIPEERPARRPR